MISSSDLHGTPDASLIGESLCWACVLPPRTLIARYAVRRSLRTIPASASSAILDCRTVLYRSSPSCRITFLRSCWSPCFRAVSFLCTISNASSDSEGFRADFLLPITTSAEFLMAALMADHCDSTSSSVAPGTCC